MAPLTVHCLTEDKEFVGALRALAEKRELSFELSFHGSEDTPHLAAADAASAIVILDADTFGEETVTLLPSYEGTSSVVVGGIAQKETLGQASAMFGSEFILKDAEYNFVSMIPLTVRKILRDRDRDMTHRDIIRSSERRYESLVQAIPDVVYKIDPNGYFTFVNESVRNFGYTPNDLVGKHFSSLVSEEDLPQVSRRRVLQDLRGTTTGAEHAPGLFDERRTGDRRTRGLEIRIRKGAGRRDDEGIVASLTSYGEITATGHYLGDTQDRFFTGTVGIIRDITQRRKSEERLTQLSLAIEQIAVGICIADPGGTVRYANPFFFRLNVLEPTEVLGNDIRELAGRYLQEGTLTEIGEAMSSGENWEDDRIIWKRSGESYWSWLKIYPIRDITGSVSQYIIFQQDITERKQGEMDLRNALEEQRRAVRSVHHRVRSSLETVRALTPSLAGSPEPAPVTTERMIAYLARFHEFVYEGNAYDSCDIGAFLKEALSVLVDVATRRERKVGIETVVEESIVSVQQALPLAVVVATVVAATVNHNFPREKRGSIAISAEAAGDRVTITVAHPGGDPLHHAADSLSNEADLIQALVSQIDGSFESSTGASGTPTDETVHTVHAPSLAVQRLRQ